MSKCEHGVDFAEYTYCTECDYSEIKELRLEVEQLEKERDKYREALLFISTVNPSNLSAVAFAMCVKAAREALKESV